MKIQRILKSRFFIITAISSGILQLTIGIRNQFPEEIQIESETNE
jgi:hypothetical protein